MVNACLVQELIRIGKLPTPDVMLTSVSPELRAMNGLNRLSPRKWSHLMTGRTDQEIADALRAVVVLERAERWVGGSVAAAIWLYRLLEQRGYPTLRLLADWCLRHRDNDYVPFGVSTSAASYQEYENELRLKSEARCRFRLEEEARRAAAAARQVERAENHWRRCKMGQARAAVVHVAVARLRATGTRDRVAEILVSGLPISAIPVDAIDAHAIADASDQSLEAIVSRIRHQRGPWAGVRKRIVEVLAERRGAGASARAM